MTESGCDVLFNISGSLNITDLTPFGFALNSTPLVQPSLDRFVVGDLVASAADLYTGFTLPPGAGVFGSGGLTLATSGTGGRFGMSFSSTFGTYVMRVGNGFTGGSLSASNTYAGHTFGSLGLTPGSLLWTWGVGANADSFTLNIGPQTTVPEPSSIVLVGLGVLGLLGYSWRRNKLSHS